MLFLSFILSALVLSSTMEFTLGVELNALSTGENIVFYLEEFLEKIAVLLVIPLYIRFDQTST